MRGEDYSAGEQPAIACSAGPHQPIAHRVEAVPFHLLREGGAVEGSATRRKARLADLPCALTTGLARAAVQT